jgi:ATP-dependent RNA helicase DDX49/DBP8
MSKKNRNKTVNKSLSEDENIDQLSENAKSESESSDHHNEDAEEEEATTSSEEDSVTNIPGQAPAPPASSFSELGVNQWLVDALAAVAIRKPTEIQRACIRPTLEGNGHL